MAAGAALSLLSPAATGCVTELPPRIELYPISMAPPARTLEVVNHDDRHAIVVPVGVAFGVTTSERCTKPSTTPPPSPSMQPAQPSLAIADATILDARDLFRSPGRHEWVLFGVKSGTTTVTLKGECATQIYEVNVVTPK
jgi:hypothetical protein